MLSDFLHSGVFTWIVLPLLVFCARIIDVSMGTLRIIFISRGKKYLAPLVGFFESLIWLLAITQVMQHLDNVLSYLAFGCGFAMGNFVGITIEERLAMGILVVRVVTSKESAPLIEALNAAGYGVTRVEATGSTGPVTLIYTIIKRKDLPHAAGLIAEFDPKAFYSTEDARSAREGVFPARARGRLRQIWPFRRIAR